MENSFPPSRQFVLIISLCLAVHSLALEHVVFTSQPPDRMYTRKGQDAVIAWNFTVTAVYPYKGVVYYIKTHTGWTVLGGEDKNGVRRIEAPYKGRVFIEDTGKLKIVNCTSNDTNTYKIEVRCSVVDDVQRTVHLTVVVPPKIISSPESDKAVVVGKPLQLNCSASGFPVPYVILTRGSTTLAMGCDGSVSWTTHSVSTADEGTYRCWAWNHEKFETDERTFRVSVVKGSTVKVTEFTESVTIIEESTTGTLRWSYSLSERERRDLANVTLHRRIGANRILERENLVIVLNNGFSKHLSFSPVAKRISWAGGGSISSEAVFSISKAEISDKGYYGISLGFWTPKKFKGFPTTQLLIGVPTKILSSPQNKTVRKGEHFVLQCNATGEPAPQIRWLKDGVEMKRNNSGPALEVKAADERSGGTYVCEARNTFGTKRLTFVVNVAGTSQKKDCSTNSKTSVKSTHSAASLIILLGLLVAAGLL